MAVSSYKDFRIDHPDLHAFGLVYRFLLMTADELTHHHVNGVAAYMEMLSLRLDEDYYQVDFCGKMGIFHDYGKLPLASWIVESKNRRFTPADWVRMRHHTDYAYSAFSRVADYFHEPDGGIVRILSTVCQQHHINYDGSGYPDLKLSGKEINNYARRIRICDSLDAMTGANKERWRPAISMDKAKEELHRYSGIYYDPDYVDVMLDILQ